MNIDISRIKGIIFDYGGTLDTGGDHWSEVIWKAWQEAGVPCAQAGVPGGIFVLYPAPSPRDRLK
ncbi:MAG: hypothetical protein K2I44_10640 [Muribaculaceae bacterium]|nr:hypothetical protein [Muribaculaceae bacterium]